MKQPSRKKAKSVKAAFLMISNLVLFIWRQVQMLCVSRPDQGHYQEKTMGVDSVPSHGYINQISLRVYRFPTLDSKFKVPTFWTTDLNHIVYKTNAQSLHSSYGF